MNHLIRLAKPWRLEQVLSDQPSLVVARKFHRPSGLSQDAPVWLTIRCKVGSRFVSVALNGSACPIHNENSRNGVEGEHDLRLLISNQLAPFNRLQLTVAIPENSLLQSDSVQPDRFDLSRWAEVALEIGPDDTNE